jgi:hypothetical protein
MMGRSTRPREFLLALAGALVAVTLAVVPAAAADSQLAKGGTPEQYSTDTIPAGDDQIDRGLVAFDTRAWRYFGAEADGNLSAPYASPAFPEGRRSWIPLVSLNPVEGLSVDLGAGRLNTLLGDGNSALNQYALRLGAAYQGDVVSWYLAGLRNLRGLETSAGGYGDLQRYRISAGGALRSVPVGVGLDVSYLDRGDQARGGDANFGVDKGVAGDMTLSVEEILFSGFLDGESSLYRRSSGSTKLGAASLTSSGQGKTPAGIRAVGGHLQFMPLMDTAFQFGGAYLQFVEDVTAARGGSRDETLGTAMYLRLTHGITDRLQLKAAFDYLFPSDTTRQARGEEDAYKVAAGLFWSW